MFTGNWEKIEENLPGKIFICLPIDASEPGNSPTVNVKPLLPVKKMGKHFVRKS